MEVMLCVPHGTDVSVLKREYPDINCDVRDEEGDVYYIGREDEIDGDDGKTFEWLDHLEAVAFCGFAEGLLPDAGALITGNGGWAQGMISRKDFSGLAVDDKTKRRWKRVCKRYWKHHACGVAARKLNSPR